MPLAHVATILAGRWTAGAVVLILATALLVSCTQQWLACLLLEAGMLITLLMRAASVKGIQLSRSRTLRLIAACTSMSTGAMLCASLTSVAVLVIAWLQFSTSYEWSRPCSDAVLLQHMGEVTDLVLTEDELQKALSLAAGADSDAIMTLLGLQPPRPLCISPAPLVMLAAAVVASIVSVVRWRYVGYASAVMLRDTWAAAPASRVGAWLASKPGRPSRLRTIASVGHVVVREALVVTSITLLLHFTLLPHLGSPVAWLSDAMMTMSLGTLAPDAVLFVTGTGTLQMLAAMLQVTLPTLLLVLALATTHALISAVVPLLAGERFTSFETEHKSLSFVGDGPAKPADLLLGALRVVRPHSLSHYMLGYPTELHVSAPALPGGFSSTAGATDVVYKPAPWAKPEANKVPAALPLRALPFSVAELSPAEQTLVSAWQRRLVCGSWALLAGETTVHGIPDGLSLRPTLSEQPHATMLPALQLFVSLLGAPHMTKDASWLSNDAAQAQSLQAAQLQPSAAALVQVMRDIVLCAAPPQPLAVAAPAVGLHPTDDVVLGDTVEGTVGCISTLGGRRLTKEQRAVLFADSTGKRWTDMLWALTALVDSTSVSLFTAGASEKLPAPAHHAPMVAKQAAAAAAAPVPSLTRTITPPPTPETKWTKLRADILKVASIFWRWISTIFRVVLLNPINNAYARSGFEARVLEPLATARRTLFEQLAPYEPAQEAVEWVGKVRPDGPRAQDHVLPLTAEEVAGAVPLDTAAAARSAAALSALLAPTGGAGAHLLDVSRLGASRPAASPAGPQDTSALTGSQLGLPRVADMATPFMRRRAAALTAATPAAAPAPDADAADAADGQGVLFSVKKLGRNAAVLAAEGVEWSAAQAESTWPRIKGYAKNSWAKLVAALRALKDDVVYASGAQVVLRAWRFLRSSHVVASGRAGDPAAAAAHAAVTQVAVGPKLDSHGLLGNAVLGCVFRAPWEVTQDLLLDVRATVASVDILASLIAAAAREDKSGQVQATAPVAIYSMATCLVACATYGSSPRYNTTVVQSAKVEWRGDAREAEGPHVLAAVAAAQEVATLHMPMSGAASTLGASRAVAAALALAAIPKALPVPVPHQMVHIRPAGAEQAFSAPVPAHLRPALAALQVVLLDSLTQCHKAFQGTEQAGLMQRLAEKAPSAPLRTALLLAIQRAT